MEDDPACGGGVEHAVDDHAMEVQAGIESRAETVDEGHRTDNANSAAELRLLRLAASDGGEDRRRLDERVPYWALQFTDDAVCQGKSGAW